MFERKYKVAKIDKKSERVSIVGMVCPCNLTVQEFVCWVFCLFLVFFAFPSLALIRSLISLDCEKITTQNIVSLRVIFSLQYRCQEILP